MKFALISDIHANATALRLVLEYIRAQDGIEKIYCTGDVVGFHTSPGECIDFLQECHVECIAGNHDAGVTGKLGQEKFPVECWEAIQWTRNNLNKRQLSFLESLSNHLIINRQFWLMHGIFGDPHHYMVGDWKHRYAFLRLRLAGIRFGFYGHIHKQTCFKGESSVFSPTVHPVKTLQSVTLDSESIYLINPGTVGHPRTIDTAARFAIVDLDKGMINFEHVQYDYSVVLARTLEVFPSHISLYKRFQSSEV